MASEDVGQLGDGQLGDFPLGGTRLNTAAPRDLVITFQMSFVCTPAIGALGAFSQTMQMSAAFTYYVDARITQHRLIVASQTAYDDKMRLTQHRLVIAQKSYPLVIQMNMSAAFLFPVVSGLGRIQDVMRMSATSFIGSGAMAGVFSSTHQMSTRFSGVGGFVTPFSAPMQISTHFLGGGDFAGAFACLMQISVSFVGPQVPAGIVGVVGDSTSSPPPPSASGSYCN